MNGGVANAKKHNYPNNQYNFPSWLIKRKKDKTYNDMKKLIIKKISKDCHNSNIKTKNYILNYFTNIFKNDLSFAIKIKNKYNLSDNEIKLLLGETHKNKYKNIINQNDIIKQKSEKDKKTDIIVKNEKLQQKLFDI